ncbi:ABC transporter permease [Actinoallomurus soli]|uniref:ABC transporter permease n=1 Tax=Actinoallomurus soli TaxID=2952535 RepID=UPI0020925D27|nr:ABC transporter permease subunit [Actinoallomurus soli]MCO5970484.1 ABC transporter permease subunit [Actinoallomurus soli]
MTTHNPRSRHLSRTGRWLRGIAGLAILVAASEVLGRAGIVDKTYLPPASTILSRAIGLAADPDFMANVLATIKAWALGLAIAVGAGVLLGLLLGGLPVVGTAVRGVLEFLRPIPSVALIPLVSLLLGTGLATETTLIVYAAIWPVLFNTIYGLQDVDPVAKETLRTFGFGKVAIMWRVSLPAAAPFIATGVRLAAAVALILAVGTEILSGFGSGLGIFIGQAEQGLDGARDVLAGTVWAGALGLVINTVLVQCERRLFRWHAAQSGGRS